VYTLATVVEVRSYSRIFGATSEESETEISGASSLRISPTLRSCAGLRKECKKLTATARTPRSRSSETIERTCSSSSPEHDRAVVQRALAHAVAQAARRQRLRLLDKHVVHVVAVLGADGEGVLEALRRQ
jgi:hypothetical protein